jgi:hypothetical protein
MQQENNIEKTPTNKAIKKLQYFVYCAVFKIECGLFAVFAND